jgi:hypothetical protein
MSANAEALAAQATLVVDGHVLANALATSCGSTVSKPSLVKGPTVSRFSRDKSPEVGESSPAAPLLPSIDLNVPVSGSSSTR